MSAPRPSGTVIERPTGELALLWLLYARVLEREASAKRKSNRKQRRHNAHSAPHEQSPLDAPAA